MIIPTMSKVSVGAKPDPETLKTMQERARPGSHWAAYENHAFDSANAGHLKFLQVGEGATLADPPTRLPDMGGQINWAYQFAGFVDLKTGEIVPEPVIDK